MPKTVKIADLIDEVNRRNECSSCEPSVRQGWNSLLESILMGADVYNGFGYVTELKFPANTLDGCVVGMDKDEDGNNIFPDETRRYYYASHKLR